ncbi:MAG: calcium-binding protein [Verrucomicrobia subdivision 3 bacterium]|nr:calcium-binding protein [Limisphaerales bacterium]
MSSSVRIVPLMKTIAFPAVVLLCLLAAIGEFSTGHAATDTNLNLTITRLNQSAVLSWFGSNAMAYQVEVSSNLTVWSNAGPALPGNNAMLFATNPTAGLSREFFRVQRMTVAISAQFNPATGVLTLTGDNLPNLIVVSRDGAGNLRVNGGLLPISGGSPAVANTTLIQIFGGAGNDQLALDETNGALPRANLFGEGDDDLLTGGSGADILNGGAGRDTLFGKGGADNLFGGDGDDTLVGGDGDDQVFGENDNDRFIWNPGDDTDLNEGGAGTDTVEVNGGNGAEDFTTTANGPRVRFDRINPAPFFLDIGTCENLVLNANGGNDTFACSGNLAALILITADGGPGDDTLLGSNGADVLLGGDNNDFIDGQQGNDVIFLGAGDDVCQWDPGDGNDTLEGQAGSDRLKFNGSAIGEIFDASANGARVRFTRNIGNILMDLDDIEALDLNALGGTDNLTVNNLSGTDLTSVNVDLASPLGTTTGDASADVVIVNGTNGGDVIDVGGAATSVSVIGLPAQVNLTNSEGANDSLVINALDGVDVVTATTLPAGIIKLTLDGGPGNDSLLGSQGADVLMGGDGDDFVLGDNGDDLAFMGTDDDLFQWDPGDGNDTIEGQAGTDKLLFNGSNASEIIDILANGGRVLFVRNIANVTMDLHDVEQMQVDLLGGADTVTLGELTTTDVTSFQVDLGSPSGSGTGDAATDSVILSGTQTNDGIAISSTASNVTVSGLSAALTIIGMEAANDTLTVNALGGADVVDGSSLIAGIIKITINGGLGVDTIIGSQGDDLISGGDGNDTILAGGGSDTVVWNPGDDNDTIEGQAGTDTLQFNGANVAENIDISANGGRLLFFRNIANVVMDCNDVETIRFEALGGADVIVVNDLSGTDVTTVNLNLAATGGAGDAQPDTVIVVGTGGNDVATVAQGGGVVTVAGLAATVNISGSEAANDRVTINTLAGDDVVDASALTAGITSLTADGGINDDVLIGSAGADVLLGGDGDDVLLGGPGIDVLDGGPGNNVVIQD